MYHLFIDKVAVDKFVITDADGNYVRIFSHT